MVWFRGLIDGEEIVVNAKDGGHVLPYDRDLVDGGHVTTPTR